MRGRPARRRQQTLDYVRSTIRTDGIAPSYAMICEELGIGTRSEVCRIVSALERDGELKRVGRGKVRRLRIDFCQLSAAS
jgi:SOS-response transcriptional repressor LexA